LSRVRVAADSIHGGKARRRPGYCHISGPENSAAELSLVIVAPMHSNLAGIYYEQPEPIQILAFFSTIDIE